MEKEKIVWQAEEFVFYEKTTDWYWYFGLVTLLLIAFSVYTHNFLFTFIICISAFTMLLYAKKVPKIITYEANDQEISMRKTHIPYSSLISFWIFTPTDKRQGEKILLLHPQKTTTPLHVIPLGETNTEELRDFLSNFIKEKEEEPPLGQIFMSLIGF